MNSEKILQVLLAPIVSEKSARLQELNNQYTFEVARDATKAEVKAAVEQLFDVKVEAVNVVNTKGKTKSFRFKQGRRAHTRKACVRLAEGRVEGDRFPGLNLGNAFRGHAVVQQVEFTELEVVHSRDPVRGQE